MNRLAGETSPYLLQHADNPVDWYPWGEEALARARAEDKPIFLSIGYSACHWCHVMERESFAVAATAELMNEHFVNVKVDREERPDIDALYMDAAVALTGSGGWPLNVFLTPEGKPFWAATYLPPVPRHGLRSFPDILATIAEVWRTQARRARGDRRVAHRAPAHGDRAAEPAAAPLDERCSTRARRGADDELRLDVGRLGRRAEVPRRAGARVPAAPRRAAADASERTLDAMAAGGMYDLVGGGFHRYSVDERWLVPHFEKMLYDNAQLAVCYLHGWLVLGKERYREVAEQTLEYMLRELALDGRRLRLLAGRRHRRRSRGSPTPGRAREGVPDELLARLRGRPLRPARRARRRRCARELFALREQRPKPARDDKAVASWNGLALAALAECGRFLERPDWIDAGAAARRVPARPALDARRAGCTAPGARASRAGTGYLDDYADVANGLLELHAATGELRWLEEAHRLALLAVELFADDENGGFFQTPADGEQLIVAPQDLRRPSRRRAATRCSPTSCCGSRGSTATTSSRSGRVSVLRARRRAALAQRARRAFGFGARRARLLALARAGRSRSSGPPDSRGRARACSRRFDPHAVIAFGPSDDGSAARGQDARRRQAGRLRLRALRLPGAGDRPGALCSSADAPAPSAAPERPRQPA